MLLIGVVVAILSWIALMGVGILVNRAVRRSADPIEAALHHVLPSQAHDIEEKYTPKYAKFLSLFLILSLAFGIILTIIGLFQLSESALWRAGLVYFAIGLFLGLRHLRTGKHGSLGKFATLFGYTVAWPLFIILNRAA
jgi:amino acid transporter